MTRGRITAICMLLLSISMFCGCNRAGKTVKNSQPSPPDYLRIDAEDTVLSNVDISGVWYEEGNSQIAITIDAGGSYTSPDYYGSGRFERVPGAVMLVPEQHDMDVAWLRVADQNGAIVLLRDTRALPVVFTRELTKEDVSILDNEYEQLLSFAILDILNQCTWSDVGDGAMLCGVSFGAEELYCQQNMKLRSYGRYSIVNAGADVNSYSATLIINGERVRILIRVLDSLQSSYYELTAYDNEDTLLIHAVSASRVTLSQG